MFCCRMKAMHEEILQNGALSVRSTKASNKCSMRVPHNIKSIAKNFYTFFFNFSSCQFKTTVRRWRRCTHLLLVISNFISEYLFLVRRQTSELVRSKARFAFLAMRRAISFSLKNYFYKNFRPLIFTHNTTPHHTSSWWSFSVSNLLSIRYKIIIIITRSFRAC